jgi:RNA polymerase sigma-70 factor, ECF subfamily
VIALIAPTLPMAETSREPDDHAALDPRVRAAQDGDTAAFRLLYREHVGRIYAFCLRTAGQPADADAITQEVFVHAWEKLETFRGECAFATWLYRIAVREVLMHHRSTSRRLRRVAPAADLEAEGPPPKSEGPDLAVDLERAVRGLPEGARMVFVLSAIDGYAHAEIAQMMGVTENTCRAHLFRAKALLREVLDG